MIINNTYIYTHVHAYTNEEHAAHVYRILRIRHLSKYKSIPISLIITNLPLSLKKLIIKSWLRATVCRVVSRRRRFFFAVSRHLAVRTTPI